MDTLGFLSHVLPSTGPYCLGRPVKDLVSEERHNPPLQQFAADDFATAATIAKRLDRSKFDVYFAVGSLVEAFRYDAERDKRIVTRVADNIRGLRCYFMDLDVGVGSNKYMAQEEALRALIKFCKEMRLPKPTITSSGGGLHVYWTLEDEVPRDEWRNYAEQFKIMSITQGFRNDNKIMADCARVLRVVGTNNYKHPTPRPVRVLQIGDHTPNEQFHALLKLRVNGHNLLAVHGPPPIASEFGSNTARQDNEPLSFPKLIANCQALRYVADPANQRNGREAIPEPAWLQAVMLVRLAKDGDRAAHLISNQDPRYTKTYVDDKLKWLAERNIGPGTCEGFQKAFEQHHNADCCNGCPSKGKIKSPAVTSKYVALLPQIIVKEETKDGVVVERHIPNPPHPFVRTPNGIGYETANQQTGTNETVIICPYDMFPKRLRYDERTMLEDDVLWSVRLPREEWVDVSIPHVSKNQMQTVLAKRGVYISEFQIPQMANFMTAYMRKLQHDIPREKAFGKMGWRKDGNFVLGDLLYVKDGNIETHSLSHALENATGRGVTVAGDYDEWRKKVAMYARPGLEAYRVYIYTALASIFYNMTDLAATCVSASGRTGLGKSTLMEVCASIWGDPKLLIVRGDPDSSTRAAAENLADAMHHLPVMLDEITMRDAKDVAQMIFMYSGGKGKIRSTPQGGLRSDTATWNNILLVNANSDEYERMASTMRDSTQHMVRLIQIGFTDTQAISKTEGDSIKEAVFNNFGWAGRHFVETVVQHAPQIRKRVKQLIYETDKAVGAKSEERFWTAWVACAQTAAEIAVNLGILQGFPVSADVAWMHRQIGSMRNSTTSQIPVASEVLAEFLDVSLRSTLTISAKGSSNIDNVLKEPNAELTVRNEIDSDMIYVNRTAFRKYCVENGINFNRTLMEMQKKHILLRDNVLKTLGAGTSYESGKVRCIEVSSTALTK